jgi:hypothetical protein
MLAIHSAYRFTGSDSSTIDHLARSDMARSAAQSGTSGVLSASAAG